MSEFGRNSGAYLTVEMNADQMVEDVRLAVNGAAPVDFLGRMGGMLPLLEEIFDRIVKLCDDLAPRSGDETE